MRQKVQLQAAVFALCAAIYGAGGAWAGDVRILETPGKDQIVIEAKEATAGEILAALAARFEFTLERVETVDLSRRDSQRLQGSLDRVLERLLRQENYVVAHSTERRGGVARIVILGSKGGTQHAAVAVSPPDGGAKPALPPQSGPSQSDKAAAPPGSTVESDSKGSRPSVEAQALAQFTAEARPNPETMRQLLMMNGVSPDAPSSDTGGAPSSGSGGMPSAEGMAAMTQLAEAKVRALVGQLERLPSPANFGRK